tara:strand:- start:183968 stop:184096 length:129 start_codon:yes stop_codon:yes gene_type:complete
MEFCHSILPSASAFTIQISKNPLEASVLSPEISDPEAPPTKI